MILDRINNPADLREIPSDQLPQLCRELRNFIQETTDAKPGHVRSSLGVTELSVVLHYLMDTPRDILIWDVGHQAYVHKVLTNRKAQFHTNRKEGGISGFTSRLESEYDPFGAGHSSTSISAAAGFAKADLLRGNSDRKVVAVIGDGSMTAGMSFEALNHIGEEGLNLLVILNDNKSSIDDNRGALAKRNSYAEYCEALGVKYLGECDGHEIPGLLENVHEAITTEGPRLLKVNTIKGKGFMPRQTEKKNQPSFQEVLGNTLVRMAAEDPQLVVISPAMLSGGGLVEFARRFPDRCMDVGIAEQHAVTLAAGLAADGMKPVVHLYSTFAQRAYDQIIHDVALQNLNVTIVIDRSGLVGADGSTHHGVYDPGFLNTIPNLRIFSPVNSAQLKQNLKLALTEHGPHIIRIPKGSLKPNLEVESPHGSGNLYRQVKDGRDAAVLSFGFIAAEVEEATGDLDIAHFNINALKPFPAELARDLAEKYTLLVTVEENSARGGLGDSLRAALSEMPGSAQVLSLSLPDQFVGHASREELLRQVGLDSQSIRQFLITSLRQ